MTRAPLASRHGRHGSCPSVLLSYTAEGGMDDLDTVVVEGDASAAVADEASKPKPWVHSSSCLSTNYAPASPYELIANING
jgi:hypothetical protein